MLDGITYGMATRGVIERIVATRCNGICTGQGILATKLIERAIAFARATRILRNGDVGRLFHAAVGNGLLYLHPDIAGSGIGSNIPNGVFPAKRLVGEFIDLVLEVCAGHSAQHVLWGKPQMPRPNDSPILHHSDDGIAVRDFIGRHFELHEGIGTAACY